MAKKITRQVGQLGGCVLIVEDDPVDVRFQAMQFARLADRQAVHAADIPAALEWLAAATCENRTPPAMVVISLDMAGTLFLAADARRLSTALVLVGVATHAGLEVVQSGRTAGLNAVFSKDDWFRHFDTIIESLLDEPGRAHQSNIESVHRQRAI